MYPSAIIRRASPHYMLLARAALITAALALSGCVTGDMGGYPQGGGSYPGSSYPDQRAPSQSSTGQLSGTVQSVDVGGGRILLDARTSGYGGASRVEVFFDQRTQLSYQGQVYQVNGLEPGDEIRMTTTRSGDRLWANTIEVVRNVRDSGNYNNGGYNQNDGYNNNRDYGSGGDLRGEVGFVDTRDRIIELARTTSGGNYGGQRIRYDERTIVEYQGQRYRPDNLQRGDIVRIQARQYGNDLIAERIWVEANGNRR